MGSKHKNAREQRRIARQIMKANQDKFEVHFGKLNKILKPKPLFVPKFIWKFGQSIFIDREELAISMKDAFSPQSEKKQD